MRDSNPHARGQLILSQPCLPFHQFPVNNMVGAARFEHAMIVTCALVTIAPRCAGLCISVPPSAYKVAFRSRTQWKRGRPVSSNPEQSARAFDIDDRIYQNALESKPIEILKVPSPYVWYLYFLFVIVVHYMSNHSLSNQLLTQSESGVPVGYRSCQVLPRAFIGWQCLSHNSIWTVKELAFADCVSVYSRPARLYIVIIRLIAATVPWGLEPHDAMHHRVHACGVELLTNHIAYNTSSMSSLPSLTTLASR